MVKDWINKIRYKSRMAKFNQIVKYLKPSKTDKFLEVGVANKEYSPVDYFLIKNYLYREKITALSVGNLSEFEANYPEINAISYNGGTFPFSDKYFDIAHSNAVIEHVGPFDSQELFLKEIVRVSKRGMITTPNKYFPIETHTRVPLVHWLVKEKYDKLLLLIGKDWATGDYMYLLGKSDMKKLIKLIGLTNYHLVRNRFLGMTMTFSLIWF